MNNIYHDHLEQLRSVKMNSHPAVSLYVPLRWVDFTPGKIFTALRKAADGILTKGGYPKLQLETPDWGRWLRQDTATLSIFHHNGVTTLIPLPTRMQPRVVVADSFHIKPIVTASQEYVDSLLLHFSESGASLYRITTTGETLIDSYLPSETLPKSDWPTRLDRQSFREFLEFLQQEVRNSVLPTTRFLGVTGASYPQLQIEDFWKMTKVPTAFYEDSFRVAVPQNAISILRLRLSQVINQRHSQAVMRSLSKSSESSDSFSIRDVVPKILKKEIKELSVSLDCMHFGHLDSKTGAVQLNKSQQNAKDDDLLDDLLELAMDHGIKVNVVPKKFLPEGKSFVYY